MGLMATIKRIVLRKTKDQLELEYLLSHGMHLGKNSTIHTGCMIDSGWPWLISIGDNVTITPNVTILAHDASTNIVGLGTKLGRVNIGNNVFIGTGSTILCNTTIGDNVIVGAGSVVTRDLPGNAVYAGAPAVQVATIEEFRNRNVALRTERPALDRIHKWDSWREAPLEDKEKMKKALENGIGFV